MFVRHSAEPMFPFSWPPASHFALQGNLCSRSMQAPNDLILPAASRAKATETWRLPPPPTPCLGGATIERLDAAPPAPPDPFLSASAAACGGRGEKRKTFKGGRALANQSPFRRRGVGGEARCATPCSRTCPASRPIPPPCRRPSAPPKDVCFRRCRRAARSFRCGAGFDRNFLFYRRYDRWSLGLAGILAA